VHDLALDIDFDEARCGNFLIEKPVEVDQEVISARNPRRDVIVEQKAIELRH